MIRIDQEKIRKLKKLKDIISGRQVKGTCTAAYEGFTSPGLNDSEREIEYFILKNLRRREKMSEKLNILFLVILSLLVFSIVLVMATDTSLKALVFSGALLIILSCRIPRIKRRKKAYDIAAEETEKKLKSDGRLSEISEESERLRKSMCRSPKVMNLLALGLSVIESILIIALVGALWMSFLDDYRILFSAVAIIIASFGIPLFGVLIMVISGVKPAYEYERIKNGTESGTE